MRFCYFCGKEIGVPGLVGRQDLCPHCQNDLHCCLNCSLYDEYAQNRCREPGADWVSDREKNNFCDFFTFRQSEAPANRLRTKEESMAKLEALFKKKPS
jgi:hypothetical protein